MDNLMMLLCKLARQAGMPHYFSLVKKIINKVGDKHIGRLLLNAETDLNTVKNYLDGIDESKQIQRVLHIDLDMSMMRIKLSKPKP